MKWLIASDIHGSALYCEKLLEAFENEKADRLLPLSWRVALGAPPTEKRLVAHATSLFLLHFPSDKI